MVMHCPAILKRLLGINNNSTPIPSGPQETHPLVRQVHDLFDRNHSADVVRLILKSIEEGAIRRANLSSEIDQTFGNELSQKIFDACAGSGCPICNKGLCPCTTCHGTGSVRYDQKCTICKSTGVSPCDFCAGSGLAAYSFFPRELVTRILLIRVHHATRALIHFKNRASVGVHGQTKTDVLKDYTHLIRLRAIFTNSLDEAREGLTLPYEGIDKLTNECRRALAHTELLMSNKLQQYVNLADTPGEHRSTHEPDRRRENFHLREVEASRLAASTEDTAS